MTDSNFALCRRGLLLSAAGATSVALMPSVSSGTNLTKAKPIGLGRDHAFDQGWLFHRGSVAGLEAIALDDSQWRRVDLPHDWSIEDLPVDPSSPARIRGPFDQKSEGGTPTGFSIGGEGWYRKRFQMAQPIPGRVEIRFDGVYLDCDVWINGHMLGNHRNGYTPFTYDLTPFLSSDGDNVLAVHVRNLGKNARWYSGSGLYRYVWLDVFAQAVRLDRWGAQIVTRQVAAGRAELELRSTLLDVCDGLVMRTRIQDANGRQVSDVSAPATSLTRQIIAVPDPKLWSPDQPYLYRAIIEVRRGPLVLDRLEISFGIRIVTFDPASGMSINGVATKLRGGCIHHDNGVLGSASFADAEHRKVALLKTRGFNAVRPSHIPFSPAFLHACDAQGLLVMYETFDVWHEPKTADDYSSVFETDWRADLDTMIRSARNHPSIVLWSIGNEIPGRNKPEGVELQWQLANTVHRLDPTRPVTAAIHGFAGHVVTTPDNAFRPGLIGTTDRTSTVFLDVVGYNYKLADYEPDHARFPQRLFFGSESFPKDVFAIWDLNERTPWLLGDFVWTAIDYLGEAGIGGSAFLPAGAPRVLAAAWPWVNAYCGDLDLIGQQKAQSLARDVAWGVSPLEIAVRRPAPNGTREALRLWGWPDEIQSWTWPDAGSEPLTIHAYSSGDRIELWLNGRKVAARDLSSADRKQTTFTLAYAPGTLEAIAFRGGLEIGRRALSTVGAPSAIRLRSEQARGSSARDALTFVAVDVVDAHGRLIPDGEHEITLAVEGDGERIAFGSANPLAVGSYQSDKALAWRGRTLAVIRGTGQPGMALVTAHASNLAPAILRLRLD